MALLVRRRGSLEPTLLAGGALVVAALVAYGSGLARVPNVEHLLVTVGDGLGRWTYLLVGVFAFVETGAFIGLVAPGETALILGGVVAGQGRISLITVIGIAWACAVAGDCASYALGRRLGRPFLERHGARFGLTDSRLAQVEAFFDRHGGKAIFIGRFVGIVRAVAPFLAGSGRMPLRRFLPSDVLGAGLWASTFLILGAVFWRSLGTLLDIAKRGALGLGIAITLIVAAVLAVRWLRVASHREQLRARVDATLDRPELRPVRGLLRAVERPAAFVRDRLLPGPGGITLTTLLAVAVTASYAVAGGWVVAGRGDLGPADATAHRWAAGIPHDGVVVGAAKLVTRFGDPFVVQLVAAIGVLGLLARRRRLDAAVVGLGTALATLIVHVAKADTGRPRPADALVATGGSAYPSGHAAHAVAWVALAIAATRAIPALRRPRGLVVGAAVALAVAVAASRVVLRAHWLSDVIGGVGAAVTAYSLVALAALVVIALRHTVPSA